MAKTISSNIIKKLAGKWPAPPARKAGSLLNGRQEGTPYKMILLFPEAPPCGRGASHWEPHARRTLS